MVNRQKLSDGSAAAKAVDDRLKRWAALARFIDNGGSAADANRIDNLIRLIAVGSKNGSSACLAAASHSGPGQSGSMHA